MAEAEGEAEAEAEAEAAAVAEAKDQAEAGAEAEAEADSEDQFLIRCTFNTLCIFGKRLAPGKALQCNDFEILSWTCSCSCCRVFSETTSTVICS